MRARFLMRLGRNEPQVGGGGPATPEFDDDFDRGNNSDVGNGWAEDAGSGNWSIQDSLCQLVGGVSSVCVQSGTPMSGALQYVKVTPAVNDAANCFAGVLLRYTNSSSAHYGIYFSQAAVEWYSATNATTGLFNELVQATGTWAGETVGVTVKGTGDNTVIRIWFDPTADVPEANGETWDSTVPDISFTTNPVGAVNTGNIVGLGGGGADSGDIITYNNFFAGTITA